MELKNETRESFIFHAEYIEDLPEENKAEFLMYIYNYAIKGIEPELSSFAKTAWIKIKRRIDLERELYEKKCSNLKQKQANKEQMKKASDTDNTPSDTDNEVSDTEKGSSETEKAKSDGEYEFEFESEFEHESERETESDAEKAPRRESPSLQAYAQKIFNIFHEAGLPCARNNMISFLQRDFKNGMAYIRKTYGPLHSDEIIGACENYARTVNNPASFITGKYSFDRFVTFKNFVDFLPANFAMDNFIDRKGQTAAAVPKTKKWQEECPDCHEKALEWSNKLEKYVCAKCGKTYTYEQKQEAANGKH